MQGLAVPVVLQDKDTWTFRISRIIFNRHSSAHTIDNVFDEEIVCGEFVVPVRGELLDRAADTMRRPARWIGAP